MRRPDRDTLRRWAVRGWPLLLFIVLAVAFAPRAMAGQATLAPVDMLEGRAPWRATLEQPPYLHSGIQTDQVEGLPVTIEFYRNLRDGDFQLWDAQVGAGGPAGTQPLWGLLSPFHVGYLFAPEWYAPGIRVFLALVTSMGFTHLLGRELGLRRGPAALAAVAFTFNAANLVLVNRIMAVFVLPVVLWAVVRLVRRPTWGRTAVLALALAWTWLEGFPSGYVYAVYTAIALGGWLLGAQLWRRWRDGEGARALRAVLRPGLMLGVSVAWGVALSAINLLPFVAELARSGALESRAYTAEAHLPTQLAWNLVAVDATGPIRTGPWWAGFNPIEFGATVGAVVLVGALATLGGAVVGRLRLPEEGRDTFSFLAAATSVILVLTYVGTPLLAAAYALPGIGQGPFHRMRYVAALGLALLAAFGLDALTGGDAPERADARRATVATRILAGVSLVALGGILVAGLPDYLELAEAAGQGGAVRSVMLGAGVGVVVAAGWALLARWRPPWRGLAWVGLAAVVFVQLAVPMRGFTPEAPVRDFFPVTPGHEALLALAEDDAVVAATELDFYPNSSTIYGYRDLRGLVVHQQDFRDLVALADPEAFDRDSFKLWLLAPEWDLDSPVYDELALRWFAASMPSTPYGVVEPVSEPATWAPLGAGDERFAPAPGGELAGALMALDADVGCDGGSITVEVTDTAGATVSATRPAWDAAHAELLGFGLPGADLEPGPLVVEIIAAEVPEACDLEVGLDAAGEPAMQWITDDPDDGVELVANEGAWIYERPTALPLVSTHASWRSFEDPAGAREALDEGGGGVDEALVVGELPDFAAAGEGVAAEVVGTELDDERIVVDTSGDGPSMVAIRQNWSPDWRATIDGEPAEVLRLNGAQMAVAVPAGDHELVLVYEPAAWRLGLAVTALALVAVGVVAVLALRRWWRDRGGQPSAAPPRT